MTRPGFIYVGAPKSGSTWLFEALRAHPEVYVVPGKSTGWFERENPGPVADYVKLFRDAGPAQIAGEIAHDAWMYPATALRLGAHLPEMRILCCLREPGAFARSSLRWWSTHTRRFGTSVDEMVAHSHFRTMIDYPGRLAPFYEAFPPEQILVVFQEDLKADAASFLGTILSFLGVTPEVDRQVAERVVNPAVVPRSAALTRTVYAAGGLLRQAGLGTLVEGVKRLPALNRALYAAPPAGEGDAALEAAVAAVRAGMRPRLDGFERMIGRPVPAAWWTAGT